MDRDFYIGLARRISRKVFSKLPEAIMINTQSTLPTKINETGSSPLFGFWKLGRISMQQVSLKDVTTKIFTPNCNNYSSISHK